MKIRSNRSQLACAAVIWFLLSSCSPNDESIEAEITSDAEDTFDIVIHGGRVIDPETGLDAIRNVGIRDGKVVEISENALTGMQAIDAADLVVSPGFIDLHSHGQSPESDIFKIHDGVTTALDLELGRPNIARWLESRSNGAILNYGASASHQYARIQAASSAFRRVPVNQSLGSEQIDTMGQFLDD